MTILKENSYKGKQMMDTANRFEGTELWDVYDRCSQAKRNAYEWCRSECARENGSSFRICSHNTFGFTVSWVTDKGTRVETPKNSYLIVCD